MTVKERLIIYLDYKNETKSAFGRKIGVSSAYVTSMRKSIDSDKLKSIALEYPDLNIEWLMTGEGEMLKDCSNFEKNEQNLTVSDMYREICRLNKIVEKQQDTITEQMGLISEQSKTINRLVFQKQDGAVANRTA